MNEYAVCTFHKCGSNWFRDVFLKVAEFQDHTFIPYPENNSRFGKRIERGGRTMHVFSVGNKKLYDETLGDRANDTPTVLAVRDPKDAIVSQYFSWRNSHKNNSEGVLAWRERLLTMSPRDGIEALIEARSVPYLTHAARWSSALRERSNVHLLKYEDLLQDFAGVLRPVLDKLELDITDEQLDAIYNSTRFEAKVKRRPGEEDQSSHYRKGVAGDSANYFDAELDRVFNDAFGEVAEMFGYTS